MIRDRVFADELAAMMNTIRYEWRTNAIWLGGSSGSGGGHGSGPGGFIGQLAQTRVAGDTTQSFDFTTGSLNNLLKNLDNIRAWEKPTHGFWADIPEPASDYLIISSGSWYHTDAIRPLDFAGDNSPALSFPVGGDRYDLLTINQNGDLAWTSGSVSATPSPPSPPRIAYRQMPLWLVYSRSSGSSLVRYDDGVNSYIYDDWRPFLGAPTFVPTTGSAYDTYRWFIDGPLSTATNFNGLNYVPDLFTVEGALFYLNETPTSGSITSDVQYSTNQGGAWTSLFSTLPTVIVGEYYDLQPTDAITLSGGTWLRANLDCSSGSGGNSASLVLYGTIAAASGGGTVAIVSVNSSDGIISSVVNETSTPTIDLSLGDITPDDVTANGVVTGTNLSGTNTGDQTITLTGDVTGSGTSTIATTLSSTGVTPGVYYNSTINVDGAGRILGASSGSGAGSLYSDYPAHVDTDPVIGVEELASPGDHVHRGVYRIGNDSELFAFGTVYLSNGTNITVTQVDDHHFRIDATPGAAGVNSIGVVPNTFLQDVVELVAGSGITLVQTSGSITISGGMPDIIFDENPPTDVFTSNVGTSGSVSHGDHQHFGTRWIITDDDAGSNASDVHLSTDDTMSITSIGGDTILFSASAATFATIPEANAGTITTKSVNPAGLPLRVEYGSLINNQSYGGDPRGAYSIDLQSVRDDPSQVTSGSYSGILSGRNNTIGAGIADSVISGGVGNNISGNYGTVSGGAGNGAFADYATAGGGLSNSATGAKSVVGGGASNTASGVWSTVGGGELNAANNSYATVGGGSLNHAYNVGATVGGGASNVSSGSSSTIGGGINNDATGDYSTIGGGSDNTATGDLSAILGGESNRGNVPYSSIPGGKNAKADSYGQFVHASGMFAEAGDAQGTSQVVFRRQIDHTGNTGWVDTFLDGSSEPFNFYGSSGSSTGIFTFDVLVSAMTIDSSFGSYRIVGAASISSGVGSILAQAVTTIYEDNTDWDVQCAMTTSSFTVQVKDAGGTDNIRWTATMRTSEVTW